MVAVGPERVWTAGELAARAGAIAAALGPGDACLVLCRGRVDFAAAVLACLHTGRRVVLPASAAPGALLDTGVELAVHDGDGPGIDLRALPDAAPIWPAQPDPGQIIVTLYTSGSTGAPKRVDKAARQLLGEARALASAFGVGPGDTVLATVPPMHIYGLLFGVLLPLVSGARMTDDTPAFPDTITARAAQASVLVSVPTQLRALLGHPPVGLRVVLSSGAPLLRSTAEAWHAAGLDPTEVLGSTETGGIAWRQQALDPRWRPLPGVGVASDGGRMIVTSPFLPDEAPWPTDDAIELDGDRFHHLGRLDDVVKVAGRRVSVAAVTQALLDAPGVSDAAVVVLPDEARGVALHALVVGAVDDAALREHLRQRLDPLPRLHRVPALPREPNGKLPAARARALLDSLLPARLVVDGDVATSRLPFPPDAPCVRGHFPGHPLVPGVALLDGADRAARAAWPELGRLLRVEVATFTRPVLPGSAPELTLRREGERVRAELKMDGEGLAQAVLRYAPFTARRDR